MGREIEREEKNVEVILSKVIFYRVASGANPSGQEHAANERICLSAVRTYLCGLEPGEINFEVEVDVVKVFQR